MKVLITGSQGQLARSLIERGKDRPNIELVAVGRPRLDLEQPGSATAVIAAIAPDVVINAAAYTAVDQAEDEPDRAFRINAEAAREIAAATVGKSRLIQLSTDYVFDGRAEAPYSEEAEPNPLNIYGRSKLAGEQSVRSANTATVVVRTAWVYSAFGRNFVRTMMEAAERNHALTVVADQSGCPTSALDVAEGLLRILDLWDRGSTTGLGETYHLAATGSASWCGFAQAIMDERRRRGLRAVSVIPICSSEWPTKADRPRNSALSSAKFVRDFGYEMLDWHSSLSEVIGRLLQQT